MTCSFTDMVRGAVLFVGTGRRMRALSGCALAAAISLFPGGTSQDANATRRAAAAADPAPEMAADRRAESDEDWQPVAEVKADLLSKLAGADESKSSADVKSARGVIGALAGLQLLRFTEDEETRKKYEDWITTGTNDLAKLDLVAAKEEKPKEEEKPKRDEPAKSVRHLATQLTIQGTPRLYYLALAMVLLEHHSAAAEPAPKVDPARDRAPSPRIRIDRDRERDLVRAACLLLAPNHTPGAFAWAVPDGGFDGLWNYDGFGKKNDGHVWDLSVSGAAMLGLASAVAMGVLELPPTAYDVPIDDGGKVRLTRQDFIDRVFDVAVQCLLRLTDDKVYSQSPTRAGVEVLAYRTFARRGPDGRLSLRVDTLARPASRGKVDFAYQPATAGSAANSYLSANGAYILLTAARIVEMLLEEKARGGSAGSAPAVGRVYRVERASDGSWRGSVGKGPALALALDPTGFYSGLKVSLDSRDRGVDDVICRALNSVATAMANGAIESEWTPGKDHAGFRAFSVMKLLVAAGHPDAIGPVRWHRKLIEAMAKSGPSVAGTGLDHLFLILAITRAYRPLFAMSRSKTAASHAK